MYKINLSTISVQKYYQAMFFFTIKHRKLTLIGDKEAN